MLKNLGLAWCSGGFDSLPRPQITKKNKVMKALVKINDKWHIAENVAISYESDILELEVKEANFGIYILPYLEAGSINGVYRLENGLLLVEVPLSNVSGIQRSEI